MDRNRLDVVLEEITSIEKKIDEGSASPSDSENRLNLLHELKNIDKLASMDLIQKAQVKWDIEGDENSKFFYGLINQNRQNQMINGIMVEGTWITDPSLIKDTFFQFYKDNFQAQDSQVLFPNLPHSGTLNSTDRDYLERLVSLEKIKEAVWDCRSSKAPGPDGFSFAFMKKYWDIIQKDMYDFINSFFASSELPYGANSSFFTLIPKVNNPTLITDFRPISLIGIHYKIIAKILANRLSKVIDKIVSKEQSAFIDGRQILDDPIILSEIIECPTSEFSVNRVLRQGDPLSPFLFILVMEGLHNAFAKAVGVNEEEVSNIASNARCIACNIPFNYLGLPIGSNMKPIASWKIKMIEKDTSLNPEQHQTSPGRSANEAAMGRGGVGAGSGVCRSGLQEWGVCRGVGYGSGGKREKEEQCI
uniref:RNA-directed DNA polymerase, eukaryota n=1 Tax=Tanacetum cinerariifolium TaxID=118510 RepID=A0A699H1L9_TANCI|nr:RNA-directed DNA polymerase, eukaryota [Tanacetum cinerariifolium]